MNELKLEVGQKVWSIQLGDCKVIEVNKTMRLPIVCQDARGRVCGYLANGKDHESSFHCSLFESNPFENQSVKPNDMVENKAELINALCEVRKSYSNGKILNLVEDKLLKLLNEL